MRKLLVILFLSLTCVAQSQVVSTSVWFAPPVAEEVEYQNFLLYSENINAGWPYYNNYEITVTADQANDLDGNPTLDKATSTAAWANVQQLVAVTDETDYFFAFDIVRGDSGTEYYVSVYDETNAALIVTDPVTYETNFYSQTGASAVRLSFAFTTPVDCVSITVTAITFGDGTGFNASIGRLQLAYPGKAYIMTEDEAVE